MKAALTALLLTLLPITANAAPTPTVLISVIAALNEIIPVQCEAPRVTGILYTVTCAKVSDGKQLLIQANTPYRNPALNAAVMISAPIDLGEKISEAAFQKFTNAVAAASLKMYRAADSSVSWNGALSPGNGLFRGGQGLSAGFQHSDQTSALFVESNLEEGKLLRLFVGLAG